MARTSLPLQQISSNNGAQLTQAGADQANGNLFVNDGKTRLVVQNGDGVSRTVTVRGVPCSHGRSVDLAVPVAAGALAVIGPFAQDLYNQTGADLGSVYVDYAAGTTAACKVTAVQHGS